ncbi:hypothetical protein N8912_03020 [Rhodobacteraceae bacterium]|nr:hypothetical protein [Paracoccaceae bacterium]MDA7777207.1 hypothetical protein [Paracoccaceae bacterium]
MKQLQELCTGVDVTPRWSTLFGSEKSILGKDIWPDGSMIPSLRVPSNWGQDRRAGNA